ncbi:MAG: methyltransferase [Bacteroidota bacterium]
MLEAVDLLEGNEGNYTLSPTSQNYLVKSSDINQLLVLDKMITKDSEFPALSEALFGEEEQEKVNHDRLHSVPWARMENLILMNERAKGGSEQAAASFAESIPGFEDCRKMIDFVGNTGYHALAILDKNQELQAHVYDLPEVCENAKKVQQDHASFDRLTYHGFDLRNNDPFGEDYDLFFLSNYLYGLSKNARIEFFKKVNKSMVKGGIFISNHMTSEVDGNLYLRHTIFELMGTIRKRPPHQLYEGLLEEVLRETGFDDFQVKQPGQSLPLPMLLLAAKKVRDI